MKPTEKNKEQFEKWYDYDYDFIISDFYDLPFEMQLGVFLAYYDSKGFFIDSEKCYDLVAEYLTDEWESGFWYKKDYHGTKGYFKTRNEAYKEAFKQANILMNKYLGK